MMNDNHITGFVGEIETLSGTHGFNRVYADLVKTDWIDLNYVWRVRIVSHQDCLDGYVAYFREYPTINDAVLRILEDELFIKWKDGGILKNEQ